MDIKGKIDEIVNKVKNDGEFKSKFQSVGAEANGNDRPDTVLNVDDE